MSLPKISGLLNNRLVHIGVPEILTAIAYFVSEEEKTLHLPKAELDRYKNEYEVLKKKFAEFYQLKNLTWKKLFNALTKDINNNNTAAQYMLGPVLREFMRDQIQDSKERAQLCNIEASGKYQELDEKIASRLLYKPLGINLETYEKPTAEDLTEEVDSDGYQMPNMLGVKDAPFTIKIYNDEFDHWERAPESKIDQTINDSDAMPSSISEAMSYVIGDNKRATEIGLTDLKKAVQTIINNPRENRQMPDAKMDIDYEKALSIAEINVKDIKDSTAAKNVKNEILTLFANERRGFFKVRADDKSDEAMAKREQAQEIENVLKKC